MTAPEQEQVISRPPGRVTAMAAEFRRLYLPDARSSAYSRQNQLSSAQLTKPCAQ